jgi:hypothetical protein
MSSVLTPPRPTRRHEIRPVLLVVALAGALGFFALLRWAIPSVAFVDHVAVVNPSVYALEVEVGGAEHHGRVGLGTVQRESTARFEEVVDQGDQWVFRFTSAGEPGGELTVSRQKLEADRWRVRVPQEVGDRLRAAGLPPSSSG